MKRSSLPDAGIPLLLVVYLAASVSCTEQHSQLISSRPSWAGRGGAAGSNADSGFLGISGNGPVTRAVVAAIDERPIGGASLSGGTTGGGLYADALAKGQLHYVDSPEEIRQWIANDTPSVLLVAEGTYSFGTAPTKLSVCSRACSPSTPLAQQTTSAANCTTEEAKFEVDDTHEFLRFGSNKTLIGLGKGAVFENAMISFSNASNVILRNLVIEDVGNEVSGVGYGINLWPGDHIWVDHCTFRNIGKGYFNIMSTLDDTNGRTVVETGYITITNNYFDGKVDGVCGLRATSVLGTNQNPALTIARNWFHRSSRFNGFLFGPSTWAHVFNNYWLDVDREGLGAACGAVVLAQGNVFESTVAALYNGDGGAGAWAFCRDGLFGKLYVPMNGGTDEDNLVDSGSTLSLNGQPTDGAGLAKPLRSGEHGFSLTAPTSAGASSETYEITLLADPASVPAIIRAEAGAGTLF